MQAHCAINERAGLDELVKRDGHLLVFLVVTVRRHDCSSLAHAGWASGLCRGSPYDLNLAKNVVVMNCFVT